jgi:hypothetical protein
MSFKLHACIQSLLFKLMHAFKLSSNSRMHSNFENSGLALCHAQSSRELSCLNFLTDLPPRSNPQPSLTQLFSNLKPCVSSYLACGPTKVFSSDPIVYCGMFTYHKLLACENREGSLHLNAQQRANVFGSEHARKCE